MAAHSLCFRLQGLSLWAPRSGVIHGPWGSWVAVTEEERIVFVLRYETKSLLLKEVLGVLCRITIRDTVRNKARSSYIHSLHLPVYLLATIVGFNTFHVKSVILRNRLRFAVSHQVVREEAMSPCLIVVSV